LSVPIPGGSDTRKATLSRKARSAQVLSPRVIPSGPFLGSASSPLAAMRSAATACAMSVRLLAVGSAFAFHAKRQPAGRSRLSSKPAFIWAGARGALSSAIHMRGADRHPFRLGHWTRLTEPTSSVTCFPRRAQSPSVRFRLSRSSSFWGHGTPGGARLRRGGSVSRRRTPSRSGPARALETPCAAPHWLDRLTTAAGCEQRS
jgi:hypothetical protein